MLRSGRASGRKAAGKDLDKLSGRPLECAPAASTVGRMDHPASDRRRAILFVEDEESISEPFARGARARGASSRVVAGTAAEALELAERIEPDLVLLDLTLPDGDGRDVCRELRRRSDVPIVMLTARGTETRPRSSASSSAPTTTSSSRSAAPR